MFREHYIYFIVFFCSKIEKIEPAATYLEFSGEVIKSRYIQNGHRLFYIEKLVLARATYVQTELVRESNNYLISRMNSF